MAKDSSSHFSCLLSEDGWSDGQSGGWRRDSRRSEKDGRAEPGEEVGQRGNFNLGGKVGTVLHDRCSRTI